MNLKERAQLDQEWAALEQMKQAYAELELDAKRYRWLRELNGIGTGSSVKSALVWQFRTTDLDREIDKAIKYQNGH